MTEIDRVRLTVRILYYVVFLLTVLYVLTPAWG